MSPSSKFATAPLAGGASAPRCRAYGPPATAARLRYLILPSPAPSVRRRRSCGTDRDTTEHAEGHAAWLLVVSGRERLKNGDISSCIDLPFEAKACLVKQQRVFLPGALPPAEQCHHVDVQRLRPMWPRIVGA